MNAITTFEQFKKDGEHSFAKGKNESQLKAVFDQLQAIKNPVKAQDNGGNTGSVKSKGSDNTGAGNGTGNSGHK